MSNRPRREWPGVSRVAAVLLGPVVAIGALLLVFAKVPFAAAIAAMRHADAGWVGGALAVAAVVQIVDAARLQRLIRTQVAGLSLWNVLRINVATQFYGLALPGGNVSGILIRCSQLPTRQSQLGAGVSMLADQLIATLAMCAAGLAFWLVDHPARSDLAGMALLGGVALVSVARLVSPVARPALRPVQWLRVRLGARGQALRDEMRPLRQLDRRTLLDVAGLAIASTLLRTLVYWLLARALGLHVSWATMGWIRSGMMLATMPPVSVAGLGLREGAALVLLGGHGVAASRVVAFSLSIFAVSTTFALLGGVAEMGRSALWLRCAALRNRT